MTVPRDEAMVQQQSTRILLLLIILATVSSTMTAAEVCVQVNDPSALPLPNAWVVATNWSEGATAKGRFDKTQAKTTGEDGRACITLPEGSYAIEAGLPGFLSVRYSPVRLSAAARVNLTYQLPIGDLMEDPVTIESVLSGTLRRAGTVIGGAAICAFRAGSSKSTACASSDEMGEYSLTIPPGKYRVEIRTADGAVQTSEIDATAPGSYRNKLSLK